MTHQQLIVLNVQINRYAEWLNSKIEFPDSVSRLKEYLELWLMEYTSVQNLASNLGHSFVTWEFDWNWAAYHIIEDYNAYRKLFQQINFQKIEHDSVLVYKVLSKNACNRSRELYLTDSKKIDSEPITFKLSQLLVNDSNFNKPQDNFDPIIGFSDFGSTQRNSEIEYIYDSFDLFIRQKQDDVWNPSLRSFEESAKRKKEQKERSKYYSTKIVNDQGIEVDKVSDNVTISVKIDAKGLKKHYDKRKNKNWINRLFGK